MARLITVDLDAIPASIIESIRAVMRQRGVIFCKESETQHGVYGNDEDKLLAEIGNNCAAPIAFMDESERAA